MGISWDGTDEAVIMAMEKYAEDALKAVRGVADYFAPVIEAYAKEHASWTDQTGNARAGLHSYVEELANDVVELWLSHGMFYGFWLEVKHAGKYAIIAPTLEAHYGQIESMLKDIFS